MLSLIVPLASTMLSRFTLRDARTRGLPLSPSAASTRSTTPRDAPVKELAQAGELARRFAFARGRDLGQLAEDAEAELGGAEGEPVAVDEPCAALLLPVDGDVRFAIDLFELEVPAVEDDLRVVLFDAPIGNRNVISEGAAHRHHRLVDGEEHGRSLAGEVSQHRHGLVSD
jgi:hypothetical protein